MPKFKLTDHDTGKSVIVSGDSAPSDHEAEQIFSDAGFREHATPPPQAAPAQHGHPSGMMDTAIDMARSIPGGIAKGASAIAGLPGDIDAGLTGVADYVMGQLDPETLQKMQAGREQPHSIPKPPTSGEVLNAVSKPFGGMYDPKTTGGQYAETVASFAPNAIAPGSAVQKAARVLVPGIASEEAGQQTKGTKWEPIARAGGALAGGIGEGIAEGIGHARAHQIMSPEELGKAKNAAYKAAEQHGVVIKDTAWRGLANDVTTEMSKGPFRPDLHAGAQSALETILAEKGPVTLENADAIRQVVNDAIETASKNNGGDLKRATKIKGMLDEFLDNITPADTVSGDPTVAVPILKQARNLAQREFKSKQIQKIIDLSVNQASGNNSALGVGQAMRQQFKNLNAQLIKNPAMAKGFSPAERAAIDRVVNGGPIENALRLFGKLAPTNAISMGVGPSLGAAIGAGIGGPVGAGIGAVGVPAAGAAARGSASLLTQRNARLAEELMRAGQVNPGAASIPRNALLSTLLSQGSH